MGFRETIRACTAAYQPLPLTHLTDAETFLRITETSQVNPPDPCPVFNERLAYLFYGRPSYRLRDRNEGTTSLISILPVCLILKPISKDIRRVYPFDSGGFHLYSDYFHHSFTMDDYELDPILDSAEKIASHFYESNHHYMKGEPKGDIAISAASTKEQAYYNLIRAAAGSGDERRSTVELQASAPLSVRDSLLAVIFPEELYSESKIEAAIKSWNALPIPYSHPRDIRVGEWWGVIWNLTVSYYRTEGYL